MRAATYLRANQGSGPITVSHAAREIVAQMSAAGHNLSHRLLMNAAALECAAELAITRPERTKKIWTPTQPNQVNGANWGNSARPGNSL
jgi:hypothetical protein